MIEYFRSSESPLFLPLVLLFPLGLESLVPCRFCVVTFRKRDLGIGYKG